MGMNIFRSAGDISHTVSILLLLTLVFYKKEGKGLSFRSQELFLVTFLSRYIDLFTTFYSVYNSTMKTFYIGATAALLYKIQKKNQDGSCVHDAARDVFPHVPYLLVPCYILAFFTHFLTNGPDNFDLFELFWTFSIYMESVAILPQLVLLQKYRKIQPLLAQAILCMGSYRALYILNWIYRSHTERGYRHHWVVYGCGLVQTILYADFFYSYMVKCKKADRAVVTTSNNNNNTSDDNTATGETEEQQQQQQPQEDVISNELTYKPLLQNKVCCCQHVSAKDEEEQNSTPNENEAEMKEDTSSSSSSSNDNNNSDSNNAVAAASSSRSITKANTLLSPPMLIFKGRVLAPIFSVSYLFVGLLVTCEMEESGSSTGFLLVGIYMGFVLLAGMLFGIYRGMRDLKCCTPATTTTAAAAAAAKATSSPESESAEAMDLKTPLLEAEITITALVPSNDELNTNLQDQAAVVVL